MNTTLQLFAAVVLAMPIATIASAEPPAPPTDRGLLGGPDVGQDAGEGRRGFASEGDRMGGPGKGERGDRRQGAGMRRFAMLGMAIRDAEPTPEQAAAIRTYLGEVRREAQQFAKVNGEEMRKLVRVRRELVADGGDLREVDAEIVALRSKFMKPGDMLRNVRDRLGPEQQERFSASLERQIRAAMERMRGDRRGEMDTGNGMPMEPRRRGGRPDGPAKDGVERPQGGEGRGPGGRPGPFSGGSIEEIFEAELLLEVMRGGMQGDRGDRGGRGEGRGSGRRGAEADRPPLDLDASAPDA